MVCVPFQAALLNQGCTAGVSESARAHAQARVSTRLSLTKARVRRNPRLRRVLIAECRCCFRSCSGGYTSSSGSVNVIRKGRQNGTSSERTHSKQVEDVQLSVCPRAIVNHAVGATVLRIETSGHISAQDGGEAGIERVNAVTRDRVIIAVGTDDVCLSADDVSSPQDFDDHLRTE